MRHRYESINGIRYHFVEAGRNEKTPPVILLHGFPETGYSWRHQINVIAEAGYRIIAPDLRGFGETEATTDVADYSLESHARDIKALIEQLGETKAILAGHDWGANILWVMLRMFPETIRAGIALSIPYHAQPIDPEKMKNWAKDKFNFLRYFEKQGAAEAEFEQSPEQFLKLFFYGLSHNAPSGTVEKLFTQKSADATLLNGFPEPPQLPAWLTEEDLTVYTNAFKKTGLTPGLNFYRNADRNFELAKRLAGIDIMQPILFIASATEPAIKFGSLDAMKERLANLEKTVLLSECGHWVQQEQADKVNKEIIAFLQKISS